MDEIKLRALMFALEYHATDTPRDPQKVVESARAFERYLRTGQTLFERAKDALLPDAS